MELRGVAIEGWSGDKVTKVERWLTKNFGPAGAKTWYIDVQPWQEDLVMNEKIYAWFSLKWK